MTKRKESGDCLKKSCRRKNREKWLKNMVKNFTLDILTP